MIKNELRIGNFTSSEIVALTSKGKTAGSFGKPALTYIEETNFERRLGRSITDETNAKPLTWGKLLEPYVFGLLPLDYILTSQDTVQHPEIKFWSGSKDGIKNDAGKTIIDIKAPLTLKSFCQLVEPLYAGLEGIDAMNAIRENHKDGEKFYWQLVSNSCIESTRFAELIVFMPYLSELPDIKMLAQNVPGELSGKHYWISMALDGELPFLLDGGFYKNLNTIRFEVPQQDKDFLKECVLKGGKLLIDPNSGLVANHDPATNTTTIEDAKEIKLIKL